MKKIETTEVVLEKLQVAMVQHVPWYAFRDSISAEAVTTTVANNCAISIYGFIARQENERVEAKWPDGWWEALKERFAPQWLLKHSPVLYQRRTLTASYVYPNIKFPDERSTHFPIVQMTRDCDRDYVEKK